MSESIWVKSTNHSSIIQNEYSHIFYTILSIIITPIASFLAKSQIMMIFAQQRTLTSITLQNSWRWDPQPASWHDLNTRSQIWDIFHNRQSEQLHRMDKISVRSEQSVLRSQSLPSLLVTMTVVGVLDTFPLMPGTDHIPIVFMSGSWFCDTFCVSHCHRYVETGAAGSSDTGGPANYCGPVKIW